MEACKVDDYVGVEQLLKNGANPTAQDFKGYDALYYAVLHNSLRSIETIFTLCGGLIHPSRVYGKKKRNLLTVTAIYSHDSRILTYLLTNGMIKFNPNQTDRFQRNALFYSLFRNKVAEVKMFINGGASLDIPDLRGLYLLDYALQFNYEEILLELVKGGARLGLKQKKGIEILMHAARVGNLDLIKALLSKNVSMCSLSPDTGENCLMIALSAGKKSLLQSLSVCFPSSMQEAINQTDSVYGETLLMKAIQRGDIDIVGLICAMQGVVLGIKDRTDKTELIHACEKNNVHAVQVLLGTAMRNRLEVGMNQYDHRQRTALIYATINQNAKVMQLLLEYRFLEDKELHVVKWKDELGKDACEYAQTDEVKLVLAKYIEGKNMVY